MALSKVTGGVDVIREDNVHAYKAAAAYVATYAVGDLVRFSTTEALAIQRCATGEAPLGEIVSNNNGNGVASIAEYQQGVIQLFEYNGAAPVLGDKLSAHASRGTIIPTRDRVAVDNTNGQLVAIAVDTATPAGVVGTVLARRL